MSATFKPYFAKQIRTVNKSPSVCYRTRLSYSSQLQKFIKSLDWLFQKRKSTVFVSLKNLITVQLSYSDTKKVQQLILSLQKKTFTNKLWGFYRLKNFKDCYSGGSTLFSHISSPRIRTISTERDNLKSARLQENRLSVFYKLMFALNKPVQMTMLRTFWVIFLYRKPEKRSGFLSHQTNKSGVLSKVGGTNGSLSGYVSESCDRSLNASRERGRNGFLSYQTNKSGVLSKVGATNGSLSGYVSENCDRSLNASSERVRNGFFCRGEQHRKDLWSKNDAKVWRWNRGLEVFRGVVVRKKMWAFDGIRNCCRRTKGFLQYLVSKESVYGVKALERIFRGNKQECLKYSMNCMKVLERRIISSKSVYRLQGVLCGVLKKRAFKSISTYGTVKKVLQKVNLLTYYLKIFSQKSKQFGFFKIKAYIKYKDFVLKKFTETLQKVSSLNKAVIFLQIRRFSKELMPFRSKLNPIPRVGSKLTTLPTIFLEGDPSFNDPEDFSFSTTNKRRTLFKF